MRNEPSYLASTPESACITLAPKPVSFRLILTLSRLKDAAVISKWSMMHSCPFNIISRFSAAVS